MNTSGLLHFFVPELQVVQTVRRYGFWFSLKEFDRERPDGGYIPPSSFGGLFAFLFFAGFFLPLVILSIPLDLWKAVHASGEMLVTGMSHPAVAKKLLTALFLFAFGTGLCLVIAPFRYVFVKFPWLFPYLKLGIADMGIMTLFVWILDQGNAVLDTSRSIPFALGACAALVATRLAVCVYFSKQPTAPPA